MIASTIKNIFATILLVISLVSSPVTRPAKAALATQCAVNQQMWLNGGGDGFGGVRTPGQTFRPSFPGKVCKIELKIYKNIPNAGALNVTLRRHNLVPIPGGAAVIPGNLIPMGFSIQTIEFGSHLEREAEFINKFSGAHASKEE